MAAPLFRAALAAAALACLAGCGGVALQGNKWAAPMADADAPPVAAAIEGFLRTRAAPPAVLVLDPLPEEQTNHVLNARLRETLRAAGYVLAEAGRPPPGARRLRYRVARHGEFYVGRVWFDGVAASCAFSRDGAGALAAAAPFFVEEQRP